MQYFIIQQDETGKWKAARKRSINPLFPTRGRARRAIEGYARRHRMRIDAFRIIGLNV